MIGNDSKELALGFLSQREHSRFELSYKLKKHGFTPKAITDCLTWLSAKKLQCDKRFTTNYLRIRQQKGYGPLRIAQELKQRGVKEYHISQSLAAVDWFALAKVVREKRFGQTMPADLNKRAKQWRFLHYRGFSSEHIKKIIGDNCCE